MYCSVLKLSLLYKYLCKEMCMGSVYVCTVSFCTWKDTLQGNMCVCV